MEQPEIAKDHTRPAKSTCDKCGNPMTRIRRPKWVKAILFWLPVRRYECYRCNRKIYKVML